MSEVGNRPIREKKKHRLLKLVAALAVIALIILAIGVFFRTETIIVEGNTKYYDSDIIEVSGIPVGKSLYGFDKYEAIEKIQASFAYASEVEIRRRIPDTVVITITEALPSAVIQQDGVYWLMDSNTRILEKISSERAKEYIDITGITIFEPAEATEVKAIDENELKLTQLKKLLSALESNDMMSHVTYIDLDLVSDIIFCYEDRLRVNLGDGSDMEYKLRYFLAILSEIPETDSGTVTFTDSKTARFIMDL